MIFWKTFLSNKGNTCCTPVHFWVSAKEHFQKLLMRWVGNGADLFYGLFGLIRLDFLISRYFNTLVHGTSE